MQVHFGRHQRTREQARHRIAWVLLWGLLAAGVFLLANASPAEAQVCVSLAPPNDCFVDSITVGAVPYTDTQSTATATMETGEPAGCCFDISNSMWYTWTPSFSGTANVNTCGSSAAGAYTADTVINIYTGSGVAALSYITGNDQSSSCPDINESLVTFSCVAGTTYRIQVAMWGSAAGGLVNTNISGCDGTTPVCTSGPPANDCFTSAINTAVSPYSNTQSATGATMEVGEPSPCCSIGKTVWYSWTAPSGGTAIIDTCGGVTNYDTVLLVYTGATLSSLSLVTFNDQGGGTCGNSSKVTFACTAGTTYKLQIGSWINGAANTLQLNINGCEPATEARNDPQGVVPATTGSHYQAVEDTNLTIYVTPPAGSPFSGCALTSGLLCNDDHPNAGLMPTMIVDTSTLVTGLLAGTLADVDAGANTLAKGAFKYTPTPNACGPKSFQYRAKDTNNIQSNLATAYIFVACRHDAPTATPDAYSVPEGQILNVASNSACTTGINKDLLCNDSDPDTNDFDTVNTAGNKDLSGPKNKVILCSQPVHGVVTLTATQKTGGGFTYTPNGNVVDQNWYGVDGFSYKLRDGRTDGVIVETPCVNVTLTITPVPDNPIAQNDPCAVATCPGGTQYLAYYNHTLKVRASEGLLVNDYDLDNLPSSNAGLSVSCAGVCAVPASDGQVFVFSNGAFEYYPPAFQPTCKTVTFTYRAADDVGALSSPATVSIKLCPRYPPVALPSASPMEIQVGSQISFSHASYTPGPGGAISGVLWNFGDGFTSTEDAPTHRYDAPGTYGVKLTAYSQLGDPGDGFVTVNVRYPTDPESAPESWRPTADAGSDLMVAPGTLVRIVGQSPGASQATFQWSQVSGPIVDLTGTQTPEVSFVAPVASGPDAIIRLALRVTANGVSSAADVVNITVRTPNELPVVRVQPVSGLPGQRVILDASRSYDPEGEPLAFRWEQTTGPLASLSGWDTASPEITLPADAAASTLVFRVQASDGIDIGEATVEVRVQSAPTGGPTIVVNLQGGVLAVHTRIPGDSYYWEFGDNATGQGPDASHVYAAPGTYQVVLHVIEGDGSERVFVRDVTVAQLAAPVETSSPTKSAPAAGLGVALVLMAVAFARKKSPT